MFKKTIPLILLLLTAALLSACRERPATPVRFQATSVKNDVDIRSVPGDNLVTFHIYSPSGIGDASITLLEGDMPDIVQIRLYVDNLDHLALEYDDLSITAAAKRDTSVRETLHIAASEAELTPDSAYWIEIQLLPAEEGAKLFGKPAQPPSFLISLPKDFQRTGHTRFSLRWIDYYR
ncbi:MAG TPA: hypothetical protein EYP25_09670 [Anaerolineae bacterium]|nr:hypothetical protein [Caldilineae bacterium]HID34814.1 hypothetical protein [Anaerolineae bacterium]